GATVIMDSVVDDEQPPDGATVVFDTTDPGLRARRSGASARLEVTAGPKAGEQFALGPGETVIGRQDDCTIVISDISVSRRHVMVRRRGASYVLSDLGSGNGTLLNGEPVEGEVELQDGDLFTMGDTEVCFHLEAAPAARGTGSRAARPARPAAGPPRPGGAPRPSPSSRPGPVARPTPAARPTTGSLSRRPGPRPVGARGLPEADGGMTGRIALDRGAAQKKRRNKLLALTAVVGVLVAGLVFVKKRQQAAAEQAAIAAEQAQIADIEAAMNEAIEAGKEATKKGDFRAASKAFKFALERAAEIDYDARDAKNRFEFAQREVANQELVEKAEEHIGRAELAKAAEVLGSVPSDSFFADRVPGLREQIKAKIGDRLLTGLGALASRDFEIARMAAEDVLAVDPENADAKKLWDDIERAGAPPKPKPKPPVQQVDYVAKALEAFSAGKLDEAIGLAAACDEPKCGQLADKLTAFRRANQNLDANASKAFSLLKAIPGGTSSPFMGPIGAKLAESSVREGIQAMGANNWSKAFKAFHQALKADPSHAVANKHMATIKAKAKELFEQAYVDKTVDPEKARREFEQVISMTAPDDELHQKSKRHIKSLGGGF
ncbi:MAG: FHA domain-containing protein, partial [Myxococcales bacterium]